MSDNPLGEFLRARRARVDPAQVGLRTLGHRRTPGLRREEVASQAGISVEYLIRLERGRDRNPSDPVVASLADALQLDAAETEHLGTLASTSGSRGQDDALTVDSDIRRLLDSLAMPAMVTTRFFDLLAVNPVAAELYSAWGLAPGDNLARHLFLSPDAPRIYLDQEELARETVGNLRSQAGADVQHPRLRALVGELSVASSLFATLWARNDVVPKTGGRKRVWHPELGELELVWSTLVIPSSPGQLVVAYQGVPGSRTESVLAHLLTDLGTPRRVADHRG